MKIITILDFVNGQVNVLQYPSDKEEEEFLISKGFDVSNCEWMVTNFEQIIIIQETRMKLISDPKVNYKIKKNLKKGYYTYSLALAHSDISGYNVCPMANRIQMGEDSTKKSTCSSVCVGYNGFAQRFPKVMEARVRKTKLFYEDR